jgi:hypothetical protein
MSTRQRAIPAPSHPLIGVYVSCSPIRLRDDHVAARTAASNQLGALLDAHWPGPEKLFCSLASDTALAFLSSR